MMIFQPRIQTPSVKHGTHCLLMTAWILTFSHFASSQQENAPEDIFDAYGVVKGLILLVIRLVSLLAFPQTLLNFVSLLIFETFEDKVKPRVSLASAPFFVVRVVTRGLYPKLVERNLKQNLETLYSLGCENFAIEGKS